MNPMAIFSKSNSSREQMKRTEQEWSESEQVTPEMIEEQKEIHKKTREKILEIGKKMKEELERPKGPEEARL